jgi:hypothetical protein
MSGAWGRAVLLASRRSGATPKIWEVGFSRAGPKDLPNFSGLWERDRYGIRTERRSLLASLKTKTIAEIISALAILCVGDDFEMGWIHTQLVFADVVELVTARHAAANNLIGKLVRANSFVIDADLTVLVPFVARMAPRGPDPCPASS